MPFLPGEIAFRVLVESVQDYAIFLLGPQGQVLTWNQGAERIKGYTADEIIGEHFSRFYTPEEIAENRPARLLEVASRDGRVEIEGWRVRKDGTRFWADVILTALKDEDGHTYAYAKVTRDLTEKRAAEERERRLLAEQEARAAAEEALIARDRFLSIASHELKTPAASLRLTVDSLLRARSTGRLDDERLESGLNRLSTATSRLDTLVNELLDVSRLQSGTRPSAMERFDFVALVRDVVERFTDADDDRRIVVTAPDESWIVGDASRLDQVVTNVMDNAVKYSPIDERVEVDVADVPGGVALTVTDRGVGIDDEAVARLFEAFGRGTNVEHIPGLGLGLFISRQIVEHHGGRIQVEPRQGEQGTVMRMWLPREAGSE
ncbi:MAG TPA: PAS domain-containing sensor histidine kinase [Candidatus Limnocylindria bacterium]|nr:PAS domain-containing sensor histidine kinase [Candidatus Limnocylindria bacterium]